MATLPRNLAVATQRLQNLKRTTIRVRPQSNDTAQSGQTITFRFPSNTTIDLHNLQFWGYVKLFQEGSPTSAPSKTVGLPEDIHGCFERVEVIVNGQSLTGSNPDYGAYHHLWKAYTHTHNRNDYVDYLESGNDKALIGENSMKSQIQNASATEMTFDGDGGNSKYPAKFPFVAKNFPGFLGGHYVRFIDTAVTGPIEVRIRLHPNSVIWQGEEATKDNYGQPDTEYGGTTDVDYQFEEMYMLMDTIAFDDDFLRAIFARRLLEGGRISFPYKNIFGFMKALTTSHETISVNLATQSLDRLWGTLRDQRYNQRKFKKYNANAFNNNFYKFEAGVDKTKFFDTRTTYQYQVANLQHPTWPANTDQAYALTKAALDQVEDKEGYGLVRAMQHYRNGLFTFVQAFNHHDGEGERVISGLDTRGASSNIDWMLNDTIAGTGDKKFQVMLFAEATSSMEVEAGQNITLIF